MDEDARGNPSLESCDGMANGSIQYAVEIQLDFGSERLFRLYNAPVPGPS